MADEKKCSCCGCAMPEKGRLNIGMMKVKRVPGSPVTGVDIVVCNKQCAKKYSDKVGRSGR